MQIVGSNTTYLIFLIQFDVSGNQKGSIATNNANVSDMYNVSNSFEYHESEFAATTTALVTVITQSIVAIVTATDKTVATNTTIF